MNSTSNRSTRGQSHLAASALMAWTLLNLLPAPVPAQDTNASTPSDSSAAYRAVRFEKNPIIYPGMPGLKDADGRNINGPSLICAPDWVKQPLGRYYLYFAHHQGKTIRLAYADSLEGPWKIHAGGVLGLSEAPGAGHIASPDVHADHQRKEIRMYFHQGGPKRSPIAGQVSFVAISSDGLHFTARREVLGKFYFRVFQYGSWYYAFAKNGDEDGVIYRSKDGLTQFEEGPHYLPGVRHTAMWMDADTLYLVYTKVGESPERILLATVDLTKDWKAWHVSQARGLLEPEKDYEGARLALKPSRYGAASGPMRQLRDPAIFEEGGLRYLLYCVAGEQGIAIAQLKQEAR